MTEFVIGADAVFPGTGHYEWTLGTGEVLWSAGRLQLYGLESAPARAEDVFELIHPEDRERVLGDMDAVRARHDGYERSFRIIRSDGEVRTLLDRGTVARDGTGRAIRLSGVETDVTSLVGRTDAVAPGPVPHHPGADSPGIADAEILDAVFHQAPVGIAIWDRDLKFVRINAMLAEMNGLAPELHIGRTVKDLLPEVQNIDGVTALFEELLRTGVSRRDVEISGSTPAAPDETRHWREHFFPIRSGGEVKGLAAIAEDITARRKAQETIDALLDELNHRSKNLVTLVLAICRQTAKTRPDDFLTTFQSRLESMSAAQDLLLKQSWSDIAVEELIRSQIPYFSELIGSRIILKGDPGVVVPAGAAQPLALAFHELTTNAVKYGALSSDDGWLVVTWVAADDGKGLEIVWQENGGPEVTPPTRKGFGSALTGDLLRSSLGAEISFDYAATGLTWSLRCAFDQTD